MPPAPAETPSRPPLWLLLALLSAGLALAWAGMSRPFHADEAGQWSLAEDARPHSATGDRFHGPTLGLAARAAFALAGAEIAEAAPSALRAVPAAFAFGILLLPWILPMGARQGAVAALLTLPFVAASTRFIQEPLMAAAFVAAAALWIRSGPAGSAAPRFLSGLCAGFALACKVSAALHLGLAALALLALRSTAPGWKGLAAFMSGLIGSWAVWQSSFLADPAALLTWWRQLARAFGVATGLAEPPLPMGSTTPWLLLAVLLGLALALRLGRGRAADRRPAPGTDFLLLAAGLAYLVHLALPYKTPWLLMTPEAVLLVLVIPCSLAGRGPVVTAAALLVSLAAAALPRRHDYVETHPDVPALAAALTEGEPPSLVLVRGDHVWPFPFYLRGLRVAYGSVPDPAQADVWILQAAGTEPPVAEGRRAVPFVVRENELWWAVAREPAASRLERALRPTR